MVFLNYGKSPVKNYQLNSRGFYFWKSFVGMPIITLKNQKIQDKQWASTYNVWVNLG
jgi:hypothetical protein